MTAAERPDATPFFETAAVGALMLAMAATPLAAAKFAQNPYFLLTLKWTVGALLVLPAAAVLVIGAPVLRRARDGDGVIAAWFGFGVLATIGAEALGPAVTRLAEMTTVAAAYFLASRAADRALVRACFAGVILPVAALVACYSIAQHLGANPLGLVAEGTDQLCATFVNRNLLAGFLAFALPLGLEAIAAARRPESRAFALAAVVPVVAALLLSRTLGAWIAVVLVLVLWIIRHERRAWVTPLVAIALGAGLGRAVWLDAVDRRGLTEPDRTRSSRERVLLWRIGADLLRERPLLGWGPGNFDLASEAKKAPYLRHPGSRRTVELPRFAHNDAVELSSEMGIPGAILWVCLMATLARRLRSEWATEHGALALSCVAVAAHGLFHWSLHDPVASLLFFAGLGALAPQGPPTAPLQPSVARSLRLATALVAALTLIHLTRVLAARTLYERALVEQGSGRLHEALWTLRNAHALDPDLAEAIGQRAYVLSTMGFPRDALRLFEEALALRPHDEGILLNIGILYHRLGELAPARRALERAIEENPNLEQAYRELFIVVDSQGDLERREELRREAAELGCELPPLRRH